MSARARARPYVKKFDSSRTKLVSMERKPTKNSEQLDSWSQRQEKKAAVFRSTKIWTPMNQRAEWKVQNKEYVYVHTNKQTNTRIVCV